MSQVSVEILLTPKLHGRTTQIRSDTRATDIVGVTGVRGSADRLVVAGDGVDGPVVLNPAHRVVPHASQVAVRGAHAEDVDRPVGSRIDTRSFDASL